MSRSGFLALLCLSVSALLLTGCAALNGTSPPAETAVPAIQGIVHGGQQPIIGAQVYLYAASTSGYGSPSVSLLGPTGSNTHSDGTNYYVTTDSAGGFSITGDYSCTAGQQVYLYVTGGSSDGNPVDTNSAITMMAVLGNCPGGTSAFAAGTPVVFIDEVTTVAAAYALAAFATDGTHIGAPSAVTGHSLSGTGIANAFANAAILANIADGTAYATSPLNGSTTVPQGRIYVLANIIAACVNTASSTSANCNTLLTNSLAGGATGAQPGNTATAIINIAHHPWVNATVMSNLFGLQTAQTPFVSNITSAPNDFTLFLVTGGNGIDSYDFLAIDAAGNAWVPSGSNSGTLSIFTPNLVPATPSNSVLTVSQPLVGTNGMSGNGNTPQGIAIDAPGKIWITDQEMSEVSVFNADGTAYSGSPITGNNLDLCSGIAVDPSGNIWVGNLDHANLSIFTSTGAASTINGGVPPTVGSAPFDLAFDTTGDVWIPNEFTANVTVLNSSGTQIPGSPFSGNGLDSEGTVAIDASNRAWISVPEAGKGVSVFTSAGAAVTGSPFTGGGLATPAGIAIDGAGNVWVGSSTNNSLAEFDSSGNVLSPSTGFVHGKTTGSDVAIDGSGNLWLSSTNYVITFIGAATPVVTPLAANFHSPYGTHAVNEP